MVIIDTLLSSLTPFLLLIGAGYVFKRTWLANQSLWDAVDSLNFRLLIPALIIGNLLQSDIFSIPAGNLMLLVFAALVIIAALTLAIGLMVPRLRRDAPAFTSVFQTATRWNASIAIVVCTVLFPQNAVSIVAIMMIAIMPVVNALNIWLMVRWLDTANVSPMSVALKIISNPIIIGCFIGILIAGSGFEVPTTISRSITLLGEASIATILLSVGAGLKFAGLRKQLLPIGLACVLRLVVAPAMVLLGGLMLAIDPTVLMIATIAMAMPTAANGYVVARQMGGDASLYSSICTIQTCLSLVSIPIWFLAFATMLLV
jgi:predicted permease